MKLKYYLWLGVLTLCFAQGLFSHPFDQVVPKIHVRVDPEVPSVQVEYFFHYRTLAASLLEQQNGDLGLDKNGDGFISEQERRERVAEYLQEVQALAVLELNGQKLDLESIPEESDAYRLDTSDSNISGVGNWLLGYALVVRAEGFSERLLEGKNSLTFYNAETRIQQVRKLSESMRASIRTFNQQQQVYEWIEVFETRYDSLSLGEARVDRIGFDFQAQTQPFVAENQSDNQGAITNENKKEKSAVKRAQELYNPEAQSENERSEQLVLSYIRDIKSGGMGMFWAIFALFFLGAWHALQPGHGKTLVAAYLIGSRGRARDSIILGLTTTFAHTSGVFLLLGVIWILQRFYPSLNPAGKAQDLIFLGVGAFIFVLGVTLVLKRVRAEVGHHHDIFGRHISSGEAHSHTHHHHHEHGHHHHEHHHHHEEHPQATLRSWEVIRLGILGGLLPCPTAFVIGLIMISQGELVLGLFLLLVFSAGLACVLSAIGMALLLSKSYLEKKEISKGKWYRLFEAYAPAFGALVITLIGFTFLLTALGRLDILRLEELFF